MSLPSLSLSRPVLAIVMNVIIVLFGAISYQFLGVREYPSIDPPVITVRTSYTGANADIMEAQVTEPLEKSINGIAGIKSISSASNTGVSNITVEFDLGVDMEAAANDVRDKVSQAVRQLPQDIDAPPVVSKADANSDAIISMTVQSNTRSQLEVSDYASNVLQERLQTIPGVSTLQIWGEKRYAMRIYFDPQKLAARGLVFTDVQGALDRENIELPAGKIVGDASEVTVKTMGRLQTVTDFENLVVYSKDGSNIYLKEVATIELGPENDETILKESGIPMVALALVPQPGANYIEIAEEFYKRYDQLKKEVPSDLQLDIALDSTDFVRKSITEVEETLLIAFVLVIIIIYLFFRSWLIALRPLIDIPVSLIATFFIMYIMGFTVNILTLLGIVLATGLVVDDGIVVTENIFKKLEKGLPPMQAAKEGSEEIFFAVIATSITLAVVFLPIVFLQGFVGQLFREFGIVVAGAVLISAFVSLTLTPVLNVKLTAKNHEHSWFYRKTEPFFRGMENGYANSLKSFFRVRWVSWVIVAACVALIFLLGRNLKEELSPLEDRSAFRFSLTAPEGTNFDVMDNFVDKISTMSMDSVPEAEIVLSVTAPGFMGSGAPNTGFVRVRLSDPSQRHRSQAQIADLMTKATAGIDEGKVFVIQEQTISSGGRRGGLPVQFVIQNNSFEKIREFLPKFIEAVGKDGTFTITDTDLKFNKPEMELTINRDKAALLGVTVQDIATTLQMAYSSRRMAYYIMNGKQYQVIGRVGNDYRNKPSDVLDLYVKNNRGELIQLSNLIEFKEVSNPPQIYHYNRYKSVTVSAAVAPDKTVGDGNKAMQKIAKETLDQTFATTFTGSSRDFEESKSNTSFAFVFALVLVYLILAAQFESFISPLVIMITVPLAIAGAVLSLSIFGQTLNIFSQIGIIMLLGLVTKNGILIVEFANQLRERGMTIKQAAREAAVMRMRPILMTSLATVLGALPIALALGAGAQSRKPLGIVVVGGLVFSLVLTLYVIPVIYTYFIRLKKKKDEA